MRGGLFGSILPIRTLNAEAILLYEIIRIQKKDGPYGSWMVPSTTPDQPSVVENEDAKTSMNEVNKTTYCV